MRVVDAFSASAPARFTARVLFPTPPLKLVSEMTVCAKTHSSVATSQTSSQALRACCTASSQVVQQNISSVWTGVLAAVRRLVIGGRPSPAPRAALRTIFRGSSVYLYNDPSRLFWGDLRPSQAIPRYGCGGDLAFTGYLLIILLHWCTRGKQGDKKRAHKKQ